MSSHEERARYRTWLVFGNPNEFADPRLAYRRLFAEGLGTFLLVLAAAGGGLLHGVNRVMTSHRGNVHARAVLGPRA